MRYRHASRIVGVMKSFRSAGRIGAAALLLAAAVAASLLASETELYGKPLRGLTAVPLAELKANPDRHRDKTIRVAGTAAAASPGEVTLSEGGASLPVRTDGSFTLPEKLAGAKVIAEGKLKGGALVATGLEVSR